MAGGAAIFWVNKEFSGNHTEVGAGIFVQKHNSEVMAIRPEALIFLG